MDSKLDEWFDLLPKGDLVLVRTEYDGTLICSYVPFEQQAIPPVVVDSTNAMNGSYRIEIKNSVTDKPILAADLQVLSADAGDPEIRKLLESLTTEVKDRKVEVTRVE